MSVEKYIYKTLNDKYIIKKRVNRKMESFGVYKTLQEARKEKKILIQAKWDYENII
ncbi:MAG: hypothetical protein LBU40_04505 [Methanobrevibacter sp.]|jgi:hypothetical protein|nr:hypothetical protein [Methanobrevibacter sp.]